MLSDMLKRLFGDIITDDNRGLFDTEDADGSDSFGVMGLPSSVEEDLRQRYLSGHVENKMPQSGDADLEYNPNDLSIYHHQPLYQIENRPMGDMLNEMQELFQSLLDPRKLNFSNNDDTALESNEDNPRNRMLDGNDELANENSPNRWLQPHFNLPDKDLDADVDKGRLSIDDIFEPKDRPIIRQHPLSHTPHGFSSSYSFSSVTTTRRSDGSVESKRTTSDSAGNKEVLVERSIGDKRHSIKRKVDQSGTEENVETFMNMNEDESKDFNQKWQNLNEGSSPVTSNFDVSSSCNDSTAIYDNIKQFFRL